MSVILEIFQLLIRSNVFQVGKLKTKCNVWNENENESPSIGKILLERTWNKIFTQNHTCLHKANIIITPEENVACWFRFGVRN